MSAGHFRREYDAGPLRVTTALAALMLSGYALLELVHHAKPWEIAAWLVGMLVGHDLVFFPVYSLLGMIANPGRRERAHTPVRISAINHLRIPALFAGLTLLVWAPLILRLDPMRYHLDTGQEAQPYLGRWLLLSGAMFAVSALLFAIRVRRHSR